MRVIGIDPGIARCGWCVLEREQSQTRILGFGLIETVSTQDFPFRLSSIAKTLREIITLHDPEVLAIEEIFFAKNVKTAIAVSHVRGVIINLGCEMGLSVHEYTPLEIKQSITGYGRADKTQIQKMLKILLKTEMIPKQDDTSDAIAVALCDLNTIRRITGKEIKA